MAKMTKATITGMFNKGKNPIEESKPYLTIFNDNYLFLKVRNLYYRIFRESMLLPFTGKEYVERALFGRYIINNTIIYSVIDIVVMASLNGLVNIEYLPIGDKDDITKPLSKRIQGNFIGLAYQTAINKNQGEREIIILPNLFDYKPLLYPLMALENNFFETMYLQTNISTTPIFNINTKDIHGSSKDVEEKIRQELRKIQELWNNGQREIIYTQNESFFKMLDLDFNKYEAIQMVINQEISKIIGLPITWLLGRSPQGMNATGEYDRIQTINILKTYGVQYILPIFNQIIHLLNIDIETMKSFNNKGFSYTKSEEELKNAFQYLNYLGVVDTYLNGDDRDTVKNTILNLFK